VRALISLCALMIHDEEYRRAEVYGQAVTTRAPNDPVAWSLLVGPGRCCFSHLRPALLLFARSVHAVSVHLPRRLLKPHLNLHLFTRLALIATFARPEGAI